MIRPGIRRLFRLPPRGWRVREEELDEEVRLHLELRAERLVEQGMSPEAARAEARRRFGPEDEARRALRQAAGRREARLGLGEWLAGVRHDLRYAGRRLLRTPGFTATAGLTLALGIGANTAIFSVVNSVLLQPVPYPGLDRLMVVWETDRNSGTMREPASIQNYLDLREGSESFTELAAFIPLEMNHVPPGADPARLPALAATHDLLPMLGIRPLLGRTFTAAEDGPGGGEVVLLGEALWRRLGADPGVVGTTLRLNDREHEVVGVVPDGAAFGIRQLLSAADYGGSFAQREERADVQLWVPLQPRGTTLSRATHAAFQLGRLRPGVTPAAAAREVEALAAQLEELHRENANRGANLRPLADEVFGPVRPALLVLLGAVGLVLLIACANVANLLLARGTARMREVAVRSALGAGRRRLARLFLLETLLLALGGAALGLALAHGGLALLVRLAPADIPRIEQVGPDPLVLGVTLLLSLLIGVLFGLVPILQVRRLDLERALRADTGRGTTPGRERGRLRAGLVALEMALAVVLLVGAGLLIRSFWGLQQVDPGFATERVLKAEYQLPEGRYPRDFVVWPDWAEARRFHEALLERASALPGVRGAAIAGAHPLNAGFTNSFTVVGREAEAADWPEISVRQVTPGYFGALLVPLLDGRLLEAQDRVDGPLVALVNRAAAERFFPGQDPIGQQVRLWGTARTIVGVVEDERSRGVAEAPPTALYLPLAQAPPVQGSLLLRTEGDPMALAQPVRALVRELDPGLAVFGVEPLARTLSRSLGQQRFTMVLLGLFAALALVLATVGVYGVLSYTVAQRTREIGIRMALGASGRRLVWTAVARSGGAALLGIVLGLAAAVALSRVLAGLLYGVGTTDPLVLTGVPLLLGLVAAAAIYLPARRATRVDPAVALREE
jgi:putative ABC transport system permease protein